VLVVLLGWEEGGAMRRDCCTVEREDISLVLDHNRR